LLESWEGMNERSHPQTRSPFAAITAAD